MCYIAIQCEYRHLEVATPTKILNAVGIQNKIIVHVEMTPIKMAAALG